MRVGPLRVRVLRSELDRMLAWGATAPAPAEQTPTDPLLELRQRLDPALQRARGALAADRKSDLAAALSALLEAAEEAIDTLEQSATGPPPDTPGQELLDGLDPVL